MTEEINDVGRLLKLERQRKSETLEMVHEATKIPIDSLKAIEEGYKVRMLTSFYYKNFVRLYARYLGMDADRLVSLIPSEKGLVSEDVVSRKKASLPIRSGKSPKPSVAGIDFSGMAGILSSRKFAGVVSLVIVFLFLVAGCFWAGAGIKRLLKRQTSPRQTEIKTPSAVKAESKPEPLPVKPLVKPVPVKAQTPVPVKAEAPAAVKAVTTPTTDKAMDTVVVTIRARSNSWLVVRLDGNINFQGILKKGNSETWTARKVIDISGNDMDLLEFEVNGKNVGRLSRRDVKGKKIRVTAQGLTVEK